MPSTRHHRRRPTAAALIAIFVMTFSSALPVAADSTAQTLPFAQDWHDTSLITTNDDWSGVPGVVGFLGQDITTGTGVDPQTLLTDSVTANDQDVIANLPFTGFTNGGVGEFQIDDPVVGLQPNGTADAPYLRIEVRTSGVSNVTVAYDLRDLDDTLDNAVQPVALQFRVGATGAWTNVPAGFVQDATTGPELATQVTAVNAVLPATVDDRPLVQVRIITANAVPADEWVGIDNLVITGSAPDDPPLVDSSTPDDGAVGVARDANLSVTFSEPVGMTGAWFDIDCTTSGNHPAAVSGGPLTFSIDPADDFAYDESCTVTVFGQNVTDQDVNDPPDVMAGEHVSTFGTVAAPLPTPTSTPTSTPPPTPTPTAPPPAEPPTVDAGGPYTIAEGRSVTVTATGSQPDGEAITYRWDLDGDGTFETPGRSVTLYGTGLDAPDTLRISVRATAENGLTDTDRATVNVIWDFGGFGSALRDLPAVNEVGVGKLPVRFSLGGDQGLAIFLDGHPDSESYACGTTPPSNASLAARAQGAKGFRYEARTGEYVFDWNVDPAWRNTCRVFVLGLADGSTHDLAFHFR